MSKKIKYISFYNQLDSKINRVSALSAINKINYVLKALNEINYTVNVISPSWLTRENSSFIVFQKKSNQGKNKFIYTPSILPYNKLFNYLSIIFSWTWLLFYLIKNCKRNEKVVIYHSVWLIIPVMIAQKLLNLKIILEIEEIYSDVWRENKFYKILKPLEYKFISQCSSYILVSEMLRKKLNINTNYITLLGAYDIKENISNYSKEGVIEVVYAGGIEKTRMGAFNAVKLIKYLPKNFRLNILGYGSEKDIKELLELINLENQHLTNKIIFHGKKTGKDFDQIMKKFHVGLNPQNIGDYMDSAFPSKILMYLSYNLNIISSNVNSIKQSDIASEVFFYDDFNDVKDFNYELKKNLIIKDLHKKFLTKLNSILND